MAVAYTPGLKVSPATVLRKERRLPLQGEVRVRKGDPVKADTVVARTHLPGLVEPVNVAHRLGVEPRDMRACMVKEEGAPVAQDEVIAISPGFFGYFRTKVTSPREGRLQLVSDTTGQVMIQAPDIPVQIDAYVDGVIDEVMPGEGVIVRTYGTFIQGIFGVGGETTGVLEMMATGPDDPLDPKRLAPEHKGHILVGGSLVTHDFIRRAVEVGVAGVIAGGIDDADLRQWMGYDLGVAVTGSEELGLTLVITEGFGSVRMAARTFELLKQNAGRRASLSGATQIRAGVIRPEIVVPIPVEQWPPHAQEEDAHAHPQAMEPGSAVRVIREPGFGSLAQVVSLPVEPVVIETGAQVRVVEIELEGGRRTLLPRANVELIET